MDAVKKNTLRTFIPNACILVLAAAGILLRFTKTHPFHTVFLSFALDSACLLLAACAAQTVFEGRILSGKGLFVPSWVRVAKYIAVSCSVLVFLTVILGLLFGEALGLPEWAPGKGGWLLCVICPILGLVSLRIDRTAIPDRRVVRMALSPPMIYAGILLLLNLLRIIGGPYPLFRIPGQPAGISVFRFALLAFLSWGTAFSLWKITLRYSAEMPPVSNRQDTEAWTEDGYLMDQDGLGGYTYRTIPACNNGCGPLAAFDLRRHEGQDPLFSEVLREMDRMHLLCVPGPTFTYVMRGYLHRYLPGFREICGREEAIRAAEQSRMGVFRYLEERVPHFVAYYRTTDGFRFFNVSDGEEDVVLTMPEFARKHLCGGKVRLFCWNDEVRKEQCE